MASYIFYILLLVALTVGLTVQDIPDFDVNSFKDQLVWNEITLNNESSHPDLIHAVETMVNAIGEAGYSIIKWVAEISAENPTVPFKLLIFLTLFAILAPIIILLVKLTIIIFLLTKEYFQNKKEKKELNLLIDHDND